MGTGGGKGGGPTPVCSRHKKSRSKIRESNRRRKVSRYRSMSNHHQSHLCLYGIGLGGGGAGGEGGRGSAAPKVGKSSEEGVRVGIRCAASVVPVQNVQSSECPGDGAEC